MKSILMSIKPQYMAKILNGEKTIEIRKKFPSDYVGWVYIYCTKNGALLFKEYSTNTYWAEEENKNYRPNYALNGKVVARFWCDKVEEIEYYENYTCEEWEVGYQSEELTNGAICSCSCLSDDELDDYLQGKKGYAWHIDILEIFDKPKEISEFHKPSWAEVRYKTMREEKAKQYRLSSAPQSWCYVEM